MSGLAALGLLLACGAEDLPPPPGGTDGDDTGIPVARTPVTTTWTAEDVGTAVTGGLSAGFPRPDLLLASWSRALSHGDVDCPGNSGLALGLEEACTSADGWTYYGFATYIDEVLDTGNSQGWSFGLVQASFTITPPEGPAWLGGGSLQYQAERTDGVTSWDFSLGGTWDFPGEPGALGEAISCGLAVTGSDAAGLTLQGPLAVGEQALFFDELAWGPAGCGWDHPAVRLQVRDPQGLWLTLADDDCDGCGTVRDGDDQDLGAACVDLRPALEGLLTGLALP